MSYFCFGQIALTDSGINPAESARQMVLAGHRADLAVFCGSEIVQNVVLEMLKETSCDTQVVVSFLVTGSQMEDTSDSIISPHRSSDGIDGMLTGIERVGEWLRHVALVLKPKHIRLLMTEGYDDQFLRIELCDFGIRAVLEAMIRKEGAIPSVEILLVGAAVHG